MTVREILKMGDPRLLRIAKPVEHFDTPEMRELIADMFETMKHANGAGLAAPQIGVDLQLVIYGYDSNVRYPEAPPVPQHGADQPGHHAAGRRRGRRLGGLPVGAGPARRRAALGAHPLHRLRRAGQRRSTARPTASTPAWCSTSATT